MFGLIGLGCVVVLCFVVFFKGAGGAASSIGALGDTAASSIRAYGGTSALEHWLVLLLQSERWPELCLSAELCPLPGGLIGEIEDELKYIYEESE